MKVKRGILTCSVDDAKTVAEALSFARAIGVKFVCGRSSEEEGGELSIPLVVESKVTAPTMLSDILDTCSISWQEEETKVACSQPWTLHAAKKLRDPELKETSIAAFDLLPRSDSRNGAGEDPFDGLIGLEEPKALVRALANAVASFGRESVASVNVVFKGSPGTGKSEMARAFSQACAQLGVANGKFESLSASQLVSNHVGETPMFVRQEFAKAKGGVLFLDEAYALTAGQSNDFGVEAVNELTYCLEKNKDVIVLAAGYGAEMEHFLEANPGLRSRFGFEVDFPDYTDVQLAEIFELTAAKRGFDVAVGVGDALLGIIGDLRREKGFANGRTMRNLLDRAVMQAALNHPESRIVDGLDVVQAAEKTQKPTRSGAIGFA